MDAEPKSPVAVALLLAAALLLYFFVLVNALQAPWLESIGQGIAAIYGLFGYVVLWLVLLALLLAAMVQGTASDGVKVGALLLHVIAGAGAVCALFVGIDKDGARAWLLDVLVLTPLLTAGFALWVRLRRADARRADIAVGMVVLALSLIPIGYVVADEIARLGRGHDPVPVVDGAGEDGQRE